MAVQERSDPETLPPEVVLEVLEEDQLVANKKPFGLRKLSLGLKILMWALRLYVLFMFAVVGYQLAQALR
jgi:hypothetical protein